MKAKVVRGGQFKGALAYALDKDEGKIVGGNMSGDSVKSLTNEFLASTKLRPDIEKSVLHFSLSAAPGEKLSDEKWGDIAADFLKLMKLGPLHQCVVIKHAALEDQSNPAADAKGPGTEHVHIYVSRIALDASVWSGQFEALNAIEATQKLEKMHGLVRTPGLESKPDRRNPTKNEVEKALRTGEKPARFVIQDALTNALNKDGPTPVLEFIKHVQAAGIDVKPNIASTGRINGFSFGFDGIFFTGQKIGAGFTWKKLQEKGVEYEQNRDFEKLAKLSGKATFAASASADSDADGANISARSSDKRAENTAHRAENDARQSAQAARTAQESTASAGQRRDVAQTSAPAAARSSASIFSAASRLARIHVTDEITAQAQRQIDEREKFKSLAEALWAWLERVFKRVAPQRAQEIRASQSKDISALPRYLNDDFFKDERIKKLRDDIERKLDGRASPKLKLDSLLTRAIRLDDAESVVKMLENGSPVDAQHLDTAAEKQDPLLFKILTSAHGTLTNSESLREMSSRCTSSQAKAWLEELAAHAKKNDNYIDALDPNGDFAAAQPAPSAGPAGPTIS